MSKPKPDNQLTKFKQAAREMGANDSEEAFDRALRKVATAPPAPVHKPAKSRKAPKKRGAK